MEADSLDYFRASRDNSQDMYNEYRQYSRDGYPGNDYLSPDQYAQSIFGAGIVQGKKSLPTPGQDRPYRGQDAEYAVSVYGAASQGKKIVPAPVRPGGDDKSYGFSTRQQASEVGGKTTVTIASDGAPTTGFNSGVRTYQGPNSAYTSTGIGYDPMQAEFRPNIGIHQDKYQSNINLAGNYASNSQDKDYNFKQIKTTGAVGGKDNVDIATGYNEARNTAQHTTIKTNAPPGGSETLAMYGAYPEAELTGEYGISGKHIPRRQLAPTGGQTTISLGGGYEEHTNAPIRSGIKTSAPAGGQSSVAFDGYNQITNKPVAPRAPPGGQSSVTFDGYMSNGNQVLKGGRGTQAPGGQSNVAFDGYYQATNQQITGGKATYTAPPGGATHFNAFDWSGGRSSGLSSRSTGIQPAQDLSGHLNIPPPLGLRA